MADNVDARVASSIPVTTRSVSYSGDAAQNMQAICVATVAGSDDAKTATDVSSANPFPVEISDGTNIAAVKAASTAAAAADKAVVVSLSPNSPAKVSDGTNTAAVKAASTAAAAADPALAVSLSPNSPVPLPTLTKGTQGSTGVSTQDLKDAGRTTIALTIEVAAAATSEALATVTESRNGAATATFTSKVITSGKRIRFQCIAMALETLGSGTAPQRVYLRLRVNTAGATTASSPEQGVWCCINNAAIVKSGAIAIYDLPDGFEFLGDGTATYGLTLTFPDWVTSTATVQAKISIQAFEY
jgi:hypothetical protein